jgi:molecular chaperone DnaK (HSP70)
MNCNNCGAALQSTSGMTQCPYCGTLNQSAPVILASDLRIETVNEVATVMIPRWSALPSSRTEIFSTGLDNQQAVSVHIMQGESERLVQNRDVGMFTFGEIPPAPRGVPQIQFMFEVAEDGGLLVTAEHLGTGKEITFLRMQLDILKK